ncbi:uncharacterized protein LOC135078934 [Ostrinia nubilalis]|uniref:uncharacterized protein LOC135078934 n=1 Tax=Ostrinia nubilalis TaxID=29057 RepID=UPI00308245F4
MDSTRLGKEEDRCPRDVVLENDARDIMDNWTEFRTNVSILQKLGVTQHLSTVVQSRILQYFGHVSRRDDNSIERQVVQGKVEGTRSRGRSPMRWTDKVKSTVGDGVCDCTRQSANRERWREIVRRVVAASTTEVNVTTNALPRA